MKKEEQEPKSETAKLIVSLYMKNKIPLSIGFTYRNYKEVTEILGIKPKKGKAWATDKKYIFKYLSFEKKGQSLTYLGVTDELSKKKKSEPIGLRSDHVKENATSISKRPISDTTYYIINHIFCNTKNDETYTTSERNLIVSLRLANERLTEEKLNVYDMANREYRNLTGNDKDVTLGAIIYMDAYHKTFTNLLRSLMRKDKATPLTRMFDIKTKYTIMFKNRTTGEALWREAGVEDEKHIMDCIRYAQRFMMRKNDDNYRNSKTFHERLEKRFRKVVESEYVVGADIGEEWAYEAFKKTISFTRKKEIDEMPYRPRNKDYSPTGTRNALIKKLKGNFLDEWQKRESVNIRNKEARCYEVKPLPYVHPLIGYSLLMYYHSQRKPQMASCISSYSKKMIGYSEEVFNRAMNEKDR